MNALRDTVEEEKRELFFIVLNQMKKEVKEMSVKLTAFSKEIKDGQRSGIYMGSEMSSVRQYKRNTRMMNIAYALAKGKRYDQIEVKTREKNEPEWWTINTILASRFKKVGLKAEVVDFKAVIR